MIATRQKLGPRRRTNGADKKTIKAGAVFRQRVNIGRAQVAVSVQTQVSPTLVVGQNHNHVRTLICVQRGTSPSGANATEERKAIVKFLRTFARRREAVAKKSSSVIAARCRRYANTLIETADAIAAKEHLE